MSTISDLFSDLSPIDSVEPLDDEDASYSRDGIKPWDPGKIRITTKSFSLRDVVDQIKDGDIDLAPDFQRGYRPRIRSGPLVIGYPLPER